MSELIITCPVCGARTAVLLGGEPSSGLYACVVCDAEFQVETPDDPHLDPGEA